MSAVCWRAWRLAFALAICAVGMAHADDVLQVGVDQARVMQLPPGVGTIVVGNPLIADATLQAGGVLVLTGKGYGATNLLALDRGGRVIFDRTVEVQTPKSADLVVVYRGDKRQSYSCSPECAPRITLGDDNEFFASTHGESAARLSGGGGAPPSK